MSKSEKQASFASIKTKQMKQFNKGDIGGTNPATYEDNTPIFALDVKLDTKYPGINQYRAKVLELLKTKLATYIGVLNTAGLKDTYGQDIEDRAATFATQYNNMLTSEVSYAVQAGALPANQMMFYKKGGLLTKNLIPTVTKFKKPIAALDLLLAMYIQRKALMDFAKEHPSEKKTVAALYKFTGATSIREMITSQKKLKFDDEFEVKSGKRTSNVDENKILKLFGSIPFFYASSRESLKTIFSPEFRTGLAICMSSGGIPPVFTTAKFWVEEDYQNSSKNYATGSFSLSKTSLRYSLSKDTFDPYSSPARGKIFMAMDESDKAALTEVIKSNIEEYNKRLKASKDVASGKIDIEENNAEENGFSEEETTGS